MNDQNNLPAQHEPKPPVKVEAKRIVEDDGPLAFLLDTARFEHLQRISSTMALAAFTPKHLKSSDKQESIANCFRVVNQAIRWGMDPFAVCDETYIVGNRLGYQGKLIAAVINARAGLAAPLGVIYNQEKGDKLAAAIYGASKEIPEEAYPLLKKYAETEDAESHLHLTAMGVLVIRLAVGQSRTSNTMWDKDPQQKLFYSGATKWARRHRPEIMLGILTDNDLEHIGAQQNKEFIQATGRADIVPINGQTSKLFDGE